MAAKILRLYQSNLLVRVQQSLRDGNAPLAVVPTGAGKTVMFSRLIARCGVPSVSIAHRKELIAQMSRGLASEGVEHRIVATNETIRMIANANAHSFGRSFVSPGATAAVASVDSLKKVDPRWAASKKLVNFDEAHHVLAANKWGRALELFSNAQVVGWTATAERADGHGLGKHSDGVFDKLIVGPSMRELIDDGHLTDYRIYAPPSTGLDLSGVSVSPNTGDYSPKQMRATMRAAEITGDVVGHYIRLCPGQRGLTFVADVEAAIEMAEAYCAAGVPAAAISAKTKAGDRSAAIRKFALGELLQLVNVGLFGEGFDLSAAAGMDVCVDVVSMVRPTKSFVVFAQQFGRSLRLGPGKTHATIIDHVGNVLAHSGPPDFPRPITLDARERRSSNGPTDVPKLRMCLGCTGLYAKELSVCPYCGTAWVPAERSTPDEVDGDLTRLDPDTLAELRAQAELAVRGPEAVRAELAAKHCPEIGILAGMKRARADVEAQDLLRERVAVISGQWRADGLADDAIYRRFYLRHGMDMISAFALKAKEAAALMEKL